jgi:hypothetical protein
MRADADRRAAGTTDVPPGEAARRSDRSRLSQVVRVLIGIAIPTVLYYALRAAGASVYLALVVSTLLSAVPAVYSLLRHRRVDALSTYFSAMMLGGLVVVLVPGSTRFLLAREGLMTGVTGVWFLLSVRAARPLAYHFTRPLLEGRFRWPSGWDQLWETSSKFRRMWKVSSVIFGLGLLSDAVIRGILAYTVRPDLVPALGLGLYVGTVVVINVVVNVYYILCRVHDPRSPLRRGDAEPHDEPRTETTG